MENGKVEISLRDFQELETYKKRFESLKANEYIFIDKNGNEERLICLEKDEKMEDLSVINKILNKSLSEFAKELNYSDDKVANLTKINNESRESIDELKQLVDDSIKDISRGEKRRVEGIADLIKLERGMENLKESRKHLLIITIASVVSIAGILLNEFINRF